MDSIRSSRLGHPKHVADVEICRDRPLIDADLIGLIRLEAVQTKAVFLSVDRDGTQSEFSCRPKNPDCDLSAVGDQNA